MVKKKCNIIKLQIILIKTLENISNNKKKVQYMQRSVFKIRMKMNFKNVCINKQQTATMSSKIF